MYNRHPQLISIPKPKILAPTLKPTLTIMAHLGSWPLHSSKTVNPLLFFFSLESLTSHAFVNFVHSTFEISLGLGYSAMVECLVNMHKGIDSNPSATCTIKIKHVQNPTSSQHFHCQSPAKAPTNPLPLRKRPPN